MMHSLRVLVVDDDRIARLTTAQRLKKGGYESDAVDNPYAALKRVGEESWDVVLTDLRMPGMSGIEFLRKVKEAHPEIDIILMTAFATVETAVEAMQAGASDYLVKPFGFEEVDLRLKRLMELKEARSELAQLHKILDDSQGAYGIVGRSPQMAGVYERIQIFADHDAPVLITGETGTGKELVSRALHNESSRSSRPFVPIACGTIPTDLAESELFGHEKGAFTGAHARRDGSFLRADGGTVLLDDIDDLPLNIQVKLLRVLQEGTIFRVGGTEEIQIDVRVIATTKVDLAGRASNGEFREDLFYRLRGLEIALPPLRDRGDDVLLLAQHFLELLAARAGQPCQGLTLEAAKILREYHWPGNVRELRRSMESAFVLCRGEGIVPEYLPGFLPKAKIEESGAAGQAFSLHLGDEDRVEFNEAVQSFEDALILWALSRAGGQQTKAAELLGLPRTTFQSKLGRNPH